MPIIRRVFQIGHGKAITLPKSWLKYFERELGFEIKEVAIEVDRILKIEPYIPPEKRKVNKE